MNRKTQRFVILFLCLSSTGYVGCQSKKVETETYNKNSDAIEVIDTQNATAYYNRGNAKWSLGDKQGALLDLSKAGELGYIEAYDVIKKIQRR